MTNNAALQVALTALAEDVEVASEMHRVGGLRRWLRDVAVGAICQATNADPTSLVLVPADVMLTARAICRAADAAGH